jgi:hypothetical protein
MELKYPWSLLSPPLEMLWGEASGLLGEWGEALGIQERG